MASKNMEYYNWYKENGICVDCKQYKSAPNRVRCEVCLVKDAEKIRTRKSRKEYNAKLRADRKSQGLCIQCAKPLCAESVCFCIEHRLKALRRNKKVDIPVIYRDDLGVCKKCASTEIYKGKLCKRCYDISCENLKAGADGRAEWRMRVKRDNRLIFHNA